MSSFRQGVAHANIETPLLIVGGLLLLVVLLAIFQQQLRRRNRKRYHAALELQSTGVLGQIQRRKDDLHRFIGKLQTQLAAREQQLRLHDELEDIVTARVETARQHDEEWDEIMRAGKKLHGKKWTQAPADDQPSLKELMELHKDELLQLKGNMASGTDTGRGKRERRQSTRAAQVLQLPPTDDTQLSPRVVPPQWQSTRRTAGSLHKPSPSLASSESARLDAVTVDSSNPWSKQKIQYPEPAVAISHVPKLDLSRLHAIESPLKDHSIQSKKSFEEVFARQATLASSLKRKKKT